MLDLVKEFPQQLKEAIAIGQKYTFSTPKKSFRNVLLTGLGGSGIGGSIVHNYVAGRLKIPFIVNKDYFLPAFVDSETLVIVSSYSGNTEETIMAGELAEKAGATVINITSGGQVAENAKLKNQDLILIPSGFPPRACLGYSLVQVLFTLAHFDLLSDDFKTELESASEFLINQQKEIESEAMDLAKKIKDKLPVIYAETQWDGVAVRFRQQLNENGKILCWHHIIPEMNHNELVGWTEADSNKIIILLRSNADFERNQMRMEINKKVFEKYTNNIVEIVAKGASYFEQAMYFIHLTDFASVHLAQLRHFDATEVKVIDFLKGELAKA